MGNRLSFLKPSIMVVGMVPPQKMGLGVSPSRTARGGARSARGRQGAVRSRAARLTESPTAPQTVQILIGLIHLGFGSVLLMVRHGHVGMLFIEGGVPFWGGACVSAGAPWGAVPAHLSPQRHPPRSPGHLRS